MSMDWKACCREIRCDILRCIGHLGVGHIGGCLSVVELLAVLYFEEMNIDPADPKKPGRDRFVCSKGHAGPAVYATLSNRGYFDKAELLTLNQGGTHLPSHCDMNLTRGIDMTTGSLGQGVSLAVGSALACKLQGRSNRVFVFVGDGECNEGQVWEACEAANHEKLDHFIVFVDWNKKQLDGRLEQISDPVDLAQKFTAFGFDTQTVKGYDVEEIWNAIERAKAVSGKPHCILLDTIKGLGVNFAEAQDFNHYMTFSKEVAENAIAEIERRLADGTYPGGDFTW